MKSIVVEIKDGFAALLSDDGRIVKVKNKNYAIGQVIEMKIQKVHFTKKLALCVASAAVLLLTTGIGTWAYTSPYSYVSLDVNPSIEYTLNRFDRVIDVKAVNDDGQVILDQIDIDGLTNESIEDAILATVNQITSEGYFGTTTNTVSGSAIIVGDGTETNANTVTGSAITIDGGLVITVANGNTEISEELAAQIQTAVQSFVGENVEVEVEGIGLERVQEARELGVTPGKLNLVQKLQASSDEEINIEDWLNKPVKDIMKQIKVNKKENPTLEVKEETTALSTTSTEASESTETPDKKADKAEEKADKAQEKADAAKVKTEEKANAKEEKETAVTVKAEEKANAAKEKEAKAESKAADKVQDKQDKSNTNAKPTENKANKDKSTSKDTTVETTSPKNEKVDNSNKGKSKK